MHPQLSDKKLVCKEFIQALEDCHLSGWARLTGQCNKQKDELNSCLRKERLARSNRNRETAKGKRTTTQKALKDYHEEV